MKKIILLALAVGVAVAVVSINGRREGGSMRQWLPKATVECQAENDVSRTAHLTSRGCYEDFGDAGWNNENNKYSNAQVAGMRPRYRACTKPELLTLEASRPIPGAFVPNAIPKQPDTPCSAIIIQTGSDTQGLLFRLVNWEEPYGTDTPSKGGWSGLNKTAGVRVALEKAKEYNVLIGESNGRDFCELYEPSPGTLWWRSPCDSVDPGLTWEESQRPGTIARVQAQAEAKENAEADAAACGLATARDGRSLQKPRPDELCRDYTGPVCNRYKGEWQWSCVPRSQSDSPR